MTALTVGMLLDEAHARAIADLRGDLATAVDLVARPVVPHLTLAVVLGSTPGEVDAALADAARIVAPMSARIRGVALVHRPGERAVVYLPVVRSAELERCHREVVGRLGPGRIEGHYRADTWIPHVTVWRGPLSPASLELVAERLAATAWTAPLTGLTRLDAVGEARTFAFGVDEDDPDGFTSALDAVGRPLGWDLRRQERTAGT